MSYEQDDLARAAALANLKTFIVRDPGLINEPADRRASDITSNMQASAISAESTLRVRKQIIETLLPIRGVLYGTDFTRHTAMVFVSDPRGDFGPDKDLQTGLTLRLAPHFSVGRAWMGGAAVIEWISSVRNADEILTLLANARGRFLIQQPLLDCQPGAAFGWQCTSERISAPVRYERSYVRLPLPDWGGYGMADAAGPNILQISVAGRFRSMRSVSYWPPTAPDGRFSFRPWRYPRARAQGRSRGGASSGHRGRNDLRRVSTTRPPKHAIRVGCHEWALASGFGVALSCFLMDA